MSRTFDKAFIAELGAHLSPDLTRRRGGPFTGRLGNDTSAWVGLNVAHHRDPDVLVVNPVVGVLHVPLETEVQRLRGAPAGPLRGVTISISIGYLMPDPEFRSWRVATESDVAVQAASVHDAVRAYGLPFMRQHNGLPQIIDALRRHLHPGSPSSEIHLITALAMNGQSPDAHEVLRRSLSAYEQDETMAAAHFRVFAANFAHHWPKPDPQS